MKRPPHSPTHIAPTELFAPLSEDRTRSQVNSFQQTLAALRKTLGRPFYAESGFILYCGDSLEMLQQLSGSTVAPTLALTSPPYNIGKSYESVLPLETYLAWSERWTSLLLSAMHEKASFWLNLGYVEVPSQGLCVPLPYLLWNRIPFYLLQEIVWNYGAGVATKQRFCPRNEKWLYFVRSREAYTFNLDAVRDPDVKYPHQKKNGKLRCNPLGKNPSDVWLFPKVTSGANRSSRERTPHPAQFPLGIVDRIVRVSSNPGEVVIDPFCGSGSTGIAATGSGRVFLGIEISASYCDLAAQRHQAFLKERTDRQSQGTLFEAAVTATL